MRFTADSENDFGGTWAWLTHTMDSVLRDLPTPKRPKTERETPLGLTRGVFLCHRSAANASRRLYSGVFRLCFGFYAVVIRLSGKCRLKSTLSGFSTFAAERLPSDSQTFGDSRGATPADSDSQRLPATPRLPATQRLSATFDFRLPTRAGRSGWLVRAGALATLHDPPPGTRPAGNDPIM